MKLTTRLVRAGIQASMDSVGDSFDNALAKNLWMVIKTECIRGRVLATRAEANLTLFEYIDGFYNPRRIQKRLGYLNPIEFEEKYYTDQAKSAGTRGSGGSAPRCTYERAEPAAPGGEFDLARQDARGRRHLPRLVRGRQGRCHVRSERHRRPGRAADRSRAGGAPRGRLHEAGWPEGGQRSRGRAVRGRDADVDVGEPLDVVVRAGDGGGRRAVSRGPRRPVVGSVVGPTWPDHRLA
ncbi:IS3 family transposase [Streptomyces sp. NPDC102437]|uniref:IS3 family transposase n=1 Tax=Streptomyces sp. NPDC102437 TaxID=3366175 RepID=UPI0037F9CBC9